MQREVQSPTAQVVSIGQRILSSLAWGGDKGQGKDQRLPLTSADKLVWLITASSNGVYCQPRLSVWPQRALVSKPSDLLVGEPDATGQEQGPEVDFSLDPLHFPVAINSPRAYALSVVPTRHLSSSTPVTPLTHVVCYRRGSTHIESPTHTFCLTSAKWPPTPAFR